MELIEAIKTRRSIRKYTDEMVPREVIKEIVEAAAYAPSWKNTQTAGYVCIEDKAVIDAIAADATLGFALNAKTLGRAKQIIALTKNDGISGFEKDGSFSTSKESGWEMFDAGIAAQTFCLAAWEKGVGSVIIGLFDDKKVGELAGIPDGKTVTALIAIGYPAFTPDTPPRKNVEELLSFK
jgi:nitroreductase